MRPAVLATDGNEVHPIVRGAKFRSRFLCESTGVPAGVALAGDLSFSSDTAKATYSTRYRTEKLTASTSCMACHSNINPVGFVFQHIDNFGRYRSIEKSYAANGTVLGNHPIDASVAIKFSPTETEKSVSNGVEFISQLAERNRLPACFATQMHRFYRLRIESSADSCIQQEVYNDLAVDPNKSLLDAFKKQILNKALLKRRIQ